MTTLIRAKIVFVRQRSRSSLAYRAQDMKLWASKCTRYEILFRRRAYGVEVPESIRYRAGVSYHGLFFKQISEHSSYAAADRACQAHLRQLKR